mmetsp:Transcript_52418/g.98340  ORF Transcript_52418/g.98340 Transcript_52418/m.98340 type:complete len:197 (-) Transcript_52418:53-643(-)
MAATYSLPEGWGAYLDPEGRTYYANPFTGQTQWEPPVVEAAALAPLTAPLVAEAPAAAEPVALTPEEDQLVQAVRDWFFTTEMETLFLEATAFADANCMVFEPELGEHKLVYTELHHQFRRLFEDKLTMYLISIGRSPEQFYAAFEKSAQVDAGTENMADVMWTALDYEFFCQLMCERKRDLLKAMTPPPPPALPP